MGYCMRLQDSNFKIKAENKDKALKVIQDMANKVNDSGSGGSYKAGQQQEAWYSWVNTSEFVNAKTLKEAMDAWRWGIEEDYEGNIDGIHFNGEKLGDDEQLFTVIAPFVEKDSYIEMHGEDGAIWRWAFNGQTMKEKTANITW